MKFKRDKLICDKCQDVYHSGIFHSVDSFLAACDDSECWDEEYGLMTLIGNQYFECKNCEFILEHLALVKQDEV